MSVCRWDPGVTGPSEVAEDAKSNQGQCYAIDSFISTGLVVQTLLCPSYPGVI
jgi:hypothetical protein